MRKKLACLVFAALVFSSLLVGTARAELVGWWKLDELSGAVAHDSSGRGNHGTLLGNPQWTAGQVGGALRLDGTDDYVSLPIGSVVSSLSSSTIALWVNFSDQGGAWQRILDFGTGTANYIYFCPRDAGGLLHVAITAGTGSWTDITGTGPLPTGWHHVALVIDGTAKVMQVLLDGEVLVRAGTLYTLSDLGTTNQNWLGRSQYADPYFNGVLDDLRIYDQLLTTADIKKVMQGEIALSSKPSPVDGAANVSRDIDLSWTSGDFAATHDVYLGTSFDDVNAASETKPLGVLVSQGSNATTYEPGRLEFGRTYYWRVDEVNAAPDPTVFKGRIWSFTTEPYAYPIRNIKATASSAHNTTTGPEKTIDGSGLDAADQHSTTSADMWLSNRKGAQPTWIQYEFPTACKLDKMLVWNSNQTTESTVGFGARDVTIEHSVDGATWMALGDLEFAQAPGDATCTANTTVDFGGVSVKFVKLTINSNWGDILPQYGLAEVRFLYVPVSATEPNPTDRATGVHPQTALSWRAGREAASHEVYFGADPNTLALTATVATPGYDVATDLLKTYYWKIVEVNEAETLSSWASDIWSFTTADFVVIDDFESYTNDSPKRVFQTWIDGAGFSADEFFDKTNPGNGSGALAGYDPTSGDIMETVLIHGGRQSMPLYYDNSAGLQYSEVERTFAAPQDWTAHGITTLVIYFRGDANNVAGPLYAKINSTKVVYNSGAAGTAFGVWKQWNIPLSSVSGVNLKSVKTLAIGVGDGSAGGTGTIFIDDIRLYAAAPQAVTAADPGANGLVLLYAMEGNVQDTSGKNNNGAASGDPVYIQGPVGMGKALRFDGLNDYVDLPIGTLLSTSSSMTIATFANMADSTSSWQRIFDFGTGSTNYMFLTPRQGTTGTMRFAIRTTVVSEQQATALTTLPFGWHHVAVVIDSAATQFRLYVDGSLVATGPGTLSAGASMLLPKDLGLTNQNWLGRSQFTADGFYNGSLDDFRIYGRALSEGEIRYLAGDR